MLSLSAGEARGCMGFWGRSREDVDEYHLQDIAKYNSR